MNLRNTRLILAALTLALVALASPVMAKESKHVHFTADAVGVLTDTDADGDFSVFELTGTATGMGAVTGETFNEILDNKHQEGIFFFRNERGDVLVFSYKITTVDSRFVGTYKVEAGAGRFAGASGDGELVVAPTHVPGTVTITMDGDLTSR